MRNDYLDILAHSGILGQKWGHRNGPPYPLSRSQMSSVEKRKNKVSEFAKNRDDSPNKSKQSKDNIQKTENKQGETSNENKLIVKQLAKAQDVYKNRGNLSDKELQDYINRYNKEQDLAKLAKAEYEREHATKVYINKKIDEYKDRALNNMMNNMIDRGTSFIADSIFPKESFKMLSPSDAYKNVSNMSNKDLQDYLNRYDNEGRLKKLAGAS